MLLYFLKRDSLIQDIGQVMKLEVLVLNDNEISELPSDLAGCKKLKELRIDGCPIKDNKVKKYLAQGEMKQLCKYLEKNGASSDSVGAGAGKKKKK